MRGMAVLPPPRLFLHCNKSYQSLISDYERNFTFNKYRLNAFYYIFFVFIFMNFLYFIEFIFNNFTKLTELIIPVKHWFYDFCGNILSKNFNRTASGMVRNLLDLGAENYENKILIMECNILI